jgi:hypothetical protein
VIETARRAPEHIRERLCQFYQAESLCTRLSSRPTKALRHLFVADWGPLGEADRPDTGW